MAETDPPPSDFGAVPPGSEALDYILGGGDAADPIHLLEGMPGAGKTTLALQYLMAGRDRAARPCSSTTSPTRWSI